MIEDEGILRLLHHYGATTKKISWSKLFPESSEECLDLLSKLLDWNPSTRMTVDEAIVHPFFDGIHEPKVEDLCPPISYFEFEFEQFKMGSKICKNLILDEALIFNSKRARVHYMKQKEEYPCGGLLMKVY